MSDTALARLQADAKTVTHELEDLPDPRLFLPADGSQYLARIDAYWAQTSDGRTRASRVFDGLRQQLLDQIEVAGHSYALHPSFLDWLSEPALESLTWSRLFITDDGENNTELCGALAITSADGQALLHLPGLGVQGFEDLHTAFAWLSSLYNDASSRDALIAMMNLADQAAIDALARDPDLYLSSIGAQDWRCQVIQGDPHVESAQKLLAKQRGDIEHLLLHLPERGPDGSWWQAIDRAARIDGLLGPQAALRNHHRFIAARQLHDAAPEWLRYAPPQDQAAYAALLNRCQEAQAVLQAALGATSSAEHYARHLVGRELANELGYDLNPDDIKITTRRTIAHTTSRYQHERSLTQAALYGLHPGDEYRASVFAEHTRIRVEHRSSWLYPALTPGYVANLIARLDLRLAFAKAQRMSYEAPPVEDLIARVLACHWQAQAFGAQMKGDITPQDFAIIEAATASEAPPEGLSFQLIQLQGSSPLNGTLLIEHLDRQENSRRLLLFTLDEPSGRAWRGFHNETQLLHEIVGWTAVPEMAQYLLDQVPPTERPPLSVHLETLRRKPKPGQGFLTLRKVTRRGEAMVLLARERTRSVLGKQDEHTPDWYRQAPLDRRQQLTAWEDELAAGLRAERQYPQVEPFERYVHRRAGEKLARLLGNEHSEVDPDTIIITSPREQLTYTQLIRDGYDDSVNLLKASLASKATFTGPPGLDLSALTPVSVARSAHGAWLADDYVAHVRATLLNPSQPGYHERRALSVACLRLGMQIGALKSRLRREMAEQDYQWLMEALANFHPDAGSQPCCLPLTLRLDNALIATDLSQVGEFWLNFSDVLQALIQSPTLAPVEVETVQGCFILAPSPGSPTQSAWLYTPGAPDGLAWRRLNRFVATLKRPGMADYYKDRCRTKANRKLAFFLADMKNGGRSPAPGLTAPPLTDLHAAAYDQPLLRRILDVEESTTGRSDMIASRVWMSIELIATAVTLPYPPAAFAIGALLAARDGYNALSAYTEGDQEQAASHLVAYWFNLAGAAGDAGAGLKGLGKIFKRLAARQSLPAADSLKIQPVAGERLLAAPATQHGYSALYKGTPQAPEHTGHFARRAADGSLEPVSSAPVHPTPAPLDSTFIELHRIRDVTPASSGHAQGVRSNARGCFIEVKGDLFQVQYDAAARHWNAVDPASPWSFFGRKPVRLKAGATWEFGTPPGLQGGGRSRYATLNRSEGAYQLPHSLTDFQVPGGQVELRSLFEPQYQGPMVELGLMSPDEFETLRKQMHRLTQSRQQALYREAQANLSNPVLPTREALPDFAPSLLPERFMEQLLETERGLVIARPAQGHASIQFLMEQMPALAKAEVSVLYLDALLTDLHLASLQKYFDKGSRSRGGSEKIKHYLSWAAQGSQPTSAAFDIYHLIKAAHRQGIEVRPLRCIAAHPGHQNALPETLAQDPAALRTMRVFYANTLINQERLAKPGLKWVALVDQADAFGTEAAPGVAQLQGAIGIRIDDYDTAKPLQVQHAGDSGANAVRYELEVSTSAQDPSSFTLERSMEPALDVLRNTRHGLDENYNSFGSANAAQSLLFARRRALAERANRFFQNLPASPRAPLPEITEADSLIQRALDYSQGFVVGEVHHLEGARKWLIEQLPALKQQGVDTLFVGHLFQDFHAKDLATLARTKNLSSRLGAALDEIASNYGTQAESRYAYRALVKAAAAQDIQTIPLDCAAAAYLQGMDHPARTLRIQTFNFYASNVISAHRAAHPESKWVALVGNPHASQFMGIQGIAQLQGVIAVRLDTADIGELGLIERDPGVFMSDRVRRENGRVMADYVLKVEEPVQALPAPEVPPRPTGVDRLNRRATFYLEQGAQDDWQLVHRGREDRMETTAVQKDQAGFYIDRPRWAPLHLKRFDTLEALAEALRKLGLKQV